MKKYLVAGAAGLALAIPTSALADEMEDMGGVSISGYMNHDFGFGSYVGGEMAADDFHQEIDAELTFKASGTTDGGLTVTATMEVDADSGAGVDESNLAIGGGFGTIILGAQDNAANRHGNKGIGGGYGGGGYYDCGGTWTPATCGGPVPNSDALGVQYDTPNIGGLQAGVSFQAEDGNEGATTTANDMNVIAVGANFSGDFAGTALTLGVNHVTQRTGGDASMNKRSWGAGAAATFAGTTLSLRYDNKSDTHMKVPAVEQITGMADTTSFGVGVDHTIGALSFGIGYGVNTESDIAGRGMKMADHYLASGVTPDGTSLGLGSALPTEGRLPLPVAGDIDMSSIEVSGDVLDTKHTMISAGMTYDLGGGVKISAGIHSGKSKNVQQPAGAPQYYCATPGTQTVVDDHCWTSVPTDGNVYVAPAPADGTPQLVDADDDSVISGATQSDPVAHSVAYSVKDIDDVGVGLRIAFSF